jgi:hypothetical protein
MACSAGDSTPRVLLRAVSFRSTPTPRADTGFFPISDGPHFVEFDWERSSAPAAFDGQFVMRIDDEVVSTLFGIDNDLARVEFVRMGVMSIKTAAASGIPYFDQFESRRARYIGPE